MAAKDETQVINLFNEDPQDEFLQSVKHADRIWRYLNEQNNSSGNLATVNFDTQQLLSDAIDYSAAFVELPIALNFGAAPTLANTRVAFKNCCSSVIGSTIVRMNNVTVSQLTKLRLMQYCRYLVDSSLQHASNTELYTALNKIGSSDQTDSPYVGSEAFATLNEQTSGLGQFSGHISTKTIFNSGLAADVIGTGAAVNQVQRRSGVDADVNNGFYERISFTSVSAVGNALQFKMFVPLIAISEIFKHLNYPITNVRWQITLNLAGKGSAQSDYPFQQDYYAHDANIANTATSTTTITGVAQSAYYRNALTLVSLAPGAGEITVWAVPKIWYQAIKMNEGTTLSFAEKLRSGSWVKQHKYLSHQYFSLVAPSGSTITLDTGVPNGGRIDLQITSAIYKPKRVWLLVRPMVRDRDATPRVDGAWANQQLISQDQSKYASGDSCVALGDVQLYVDSKPFFESPLNVGGADPYQLYSLLMEQTHSAYTDPRVSRTLTFADWLKYNSVMCLDLSRSEMSDRNVSLRLVAQRYDQRSATGVLLFPATAHCTIDALVEYECELEYDMGKSTVKVSQI